MSDDTTNDPPATSTLPDQLWDLLESTYQAYSKASRDQLPEERRQHGEFLARLATTAREESGWPIRALAEPCGVTAERLRQIIVSYHTDDASGPEVPTTLFPRYEASANPKRSRAPRSSVQRSHLTHDEAMELRELADIASQNTGSRKMDSPYRTASERFTTLIMEYHRRGVIWEDIANASGLTISGVRMRAARYGYGKGRPPSLQPKRGVWVHRSSPTKAEHNTDDSTPQAPESQSPDSKSA